MHRPEAVADLDARFAISGIAKVVSGNGGLSKVLVTGTDADGEMYLQAFMSLHGYPKEPARFSISVRILRGRMARLFAAGCQCRFLGSPREPMEAARRHTD